MAWRWEPYQSVEERRNKSARALAELRRKGHALAPLRVDGRAIASTFWGEAWCENLERYSDFSNRLPRGRSYLRNGAVLDLQIAGGTVRALVSGSDVYRVTVTVAPLEAATWAAVCADCSAGIDSLVDLLRGRLSAGVMERLCREDDGLFPSPDEIELDCSCPDAAAMCKHVAAVLYGVGARLDRQPELFFTLRSVDEKELIARAAAQPLAAERPAAALGADEDLSSLFGLEMERPAPPAPAAPPARKTKKPRPAARRPAPGEGLRTIVERFLHGLVEELLDAHERRVAAEARRRSPPRRSSTHPPRPTPVLRSSRGKRSGH